MKNAIPLSSTIRMTHVATLRQQDLNIWAADASRLESRAEKGREQAEVWVRQAEIERDAAIGERDGARACLEATRADRDRLHAQRDWLIAVVIGLLAGLGYAGIRLAQDPPRAAPSEITGDPERIQLETLRIGPEPLRAPGGNVYAL